MIPLNANNERVKRRYREYLREARRLAPATIDLALSDIFHYEEFTGHKDFKKWAIGDAIAFKQSLAVDPSAIRGNPRSRATLVSKLGRIQRFFIWLSDEPGYRSKIKRRDVDYFNPSNRDIKLAGAPRPKDAPTLEQARQAILSMPSATDVQLRDRAVVACALLTGIRAAALASLKLKHVRADRKGVDQDAAEVNTKGSKSYTAYFYAVGDDILQILLDYVAYLQNALAWQPDDPLFPATRQERGQDRAFHVTGLKPVHWKTADPVRKCFADAFGRIGLSYRPHSLRRCLAVVGEQRCHTFEEFKAWSQNLGHEDLRTTFKYYGAVDEARQAEIIAALNGERAPDVAKVEALLLLPEIQKFLRS